LLMKKESKTKSFVWKKKIDGNNFRSSRKK